MKNFNPHDTKRLTSFLEQPSSVSTLKNGNIISYNYNKENPETWNGIVWNDNGECFVISWYGKEHLSGILNLNDCKGLSMVNLDNNNITSISTKNCFELEHLTCKHNKISELNTSGCYNLHTLKITGNPLIEITLIACDRLKLSDLSVRPTILGRAISSHEIHTDPLIQFLLKSEIYALTSKEYFNQRQQLKDRKREMEYHFPFTPEQVAKIEGINTCLDKKYRAAIKQAEKLADIGMNQVENDPFINDYEIEFVVDIYSTSKYDHISEMDGIPIYSELTSLGFLKHEFQKQKESGKNSSINQPESGSLTWFLEETHNEYRYQTNHPLQHQHHCWLFHELYDHTYLAWQDILDMEAIWIDVVLVTQHCGEFTGTPDSLQAKQ